MTAAEYHAVPEFRDRGGNLAFLSANNVFWRIDVHGQTMRRVAKWRDLGRPEAALIGVQYLANDRGRRKAPWLVRPGPSPRGSSRASRGGTDSSSPRERRDRRDRAELTSGPALVAEIPNLFGPRLTAQMTYYETPAGAKVFAAGAFTLAANTYDPPVRRFLHNLWAGLSQP